MGAGLSRLTRIDRNQISIGFGSLALFWFIYRITKNKGGGSKSVLLHPAQLEAFQNGPIRVSDVTDYPSLPEIISADKLARRTPGNSRNNPYYVRFDENVKAKYRHPNARTSNSVIEIWRLKETHNNLCESTFDNISEASGSKMVCHHHYALPEVATERKISKGCQTRGTIKMSGKHSAIKNQPTADKVRSARQLLPSEIAVKEKEIRDVESVPKEGDLPGEEVLLKNEILSRYSLEPAESSIAGKLQKKPSPSPVKTDQPYYDVNFKTSINHVPSKLPIIESLLKIQAPPPPPVVYSKPPDNSMHALQSKKQLVSVLKDSSKIGSHTNLQSSSQQLQPSTTKKKVSYMPTMDSDRDGKGVSSLNMAMIPLVSSVHSMLSGKTESSVSSSYNDSFKPESSVSSSYNDSFKPESSVSSSYNDSFKPESSVSSSYNDSFTEEIISVHTLLPVTESFGNIQPSTIFSSSTPPVNELNNNVEYLDEGIFAVPSTLPIIESHSSVQPPPPSVHSNNSERDEALALAERELILEEWMRSEILSALSDDATLVSLGNVHYLLSPVSSTTTNVTPHASCEISDMYVSYPDGTFVARTSRNTPESPAHEDINEKMYEGSLPAINIESGTESLFNIQGLPSMFSSLPTVSGLPGATSSSKRDEQSIHEPIGNDFMSQSLINVLEVTSLFSFTPITSLYDEESFFSKYDEQSICQRIDARSESETELVGDILSPPSLFTLAGTSTFGQYKDECFLHSENTDSSHDSRAELRVNVLTPPPLFSSTSVLPAESSNTKNDTSECDDIEATVEERSTTSEHRYEPSKETLIHTQDLPPTASSNKSITFAPSLHTEYTASLFSIPSSHSSLEESLKMLIPSELENTSDLASKKSFALSQPEYEEPLTDIDAAVLNAALKGSILKQPSNQTTSLGSKKSIVGFVYAEDQSDIMATALSRHSKRRLAVELDQVPSLKLLHAQNPSSSRADKDLHAILDYDMYPEVESTERKEVKGPIVEASRGNRPRTEVQSRGASLNRGKPVDLLGPVHTRRVTPLSAKSRENVAKEHDRNIPKKIVIEPQTDPPAESKRKLWRR